MIWNVAIYCAGVGRSTDVAAASAPWFSSTCSLSECSESLQFGAAFFAEGTQRIYGAAVHQLSELWKGLVRRKIRIDDHSNDRLRFFNDGGARQNAHSVYQGVHADHRP